MRSTINLYNEDCLLAMQKMVDNQYDLAIVDPPYGLFKNGKEFGYKINTFNKMKEAEKWDEPPNKEYFTELFRISKNQIIWGMQYFVEFLPSFSTLIIWDKGTGKSVRADGESAFCSIKGTLRIWKHLWSGAFKWSEHGIKRIHPTQKPVALYK